MELRKITLTENKPPQFDGQWAVGEVLQMAQQLAAWVERLQVNSPPAPEAPSRAEIEGKARDAIVRDAISN